MIASNIKFQALDKGSTPKNGSDEPQEKGRQPHAFTSIKDGKPKDKSGYQGLCGGPLNVKNEVPLKKNELAMGWSMNAQRGLACGLLHTPATSIASSHKGAASLCMSTVREGLDIYAGDDMSVTKELLHSVALVIRSDREVCCDVEKWKVWKKGEHGIVDKLIPDYAWKVLRRLQESGHGSYLVGGSVRDLLLKKPPKDFDVITTAPLNKVRKGFSRAWIVGRRFPICTVHVGNKVVEVSSFNTLAKVPAKAKLPGSHYVLDSAAAWSFSASEKCHHVRWENSRKRDFTINGLFYDPFEETLYDYLGGVEDLRKKKF
ncbi:hypothetical protein L7F22_048522 [Adiantum nelumboides]|nr:hypothetical protein [Adiantum nelumboides]